jgi:putative aldouronate transport system substrate-binding protein
MAAGSAPDLSYTYDMNNINNFRDQGGLVNLAPFVDSHLPDMKRLLADDPAFPGQDFIWRNRMPDGRMFSLPSYRIALAIRNVFIRQDWLNTLGLPLPRNLQEFHNTLIAFRDRDPGNVGRANLIPFMTDETVRWNLAEFILHHVQPNMSDRDRFIYNFGGGAARNLATPGLKEGVRLMNQWFNEGLIFPDFPLVPQGSDDFNNTLKSGFVGAMSGNWDIPFRLDFNLNVDLRANVPGAEFVPVYLGLNNNEIHDKVGLQMFIPIFSRNQEAALRYLNWLAIPENYEFIQRGPEGITHRMVGGVPQLIPAPANDPWFQNSAMNIDFTMAQNGVETGNPESNARVIALTYGGFAPEVIVNAFQISMINGRAPVVVPFPTSQDGIYGATLRDKADALLAQAIRARPADFDRIWDAGFQDWMQSGGRAVMDERIAVANQAGLR